MKHKNMKYEFEKKNLSVSLRDDADKSVFNEIFKFREYRCAESVIIDAKNTIIDAGAHAGFFTLYAKCFNPSVKIIALEPDKNNLSAMEELIEKNELRNIETALTALSGVSGSRFLLISNDSHNHRLSEIEESVVGKSNVAVSAISLSDLLKTEKEISLLKMDIEGGEFEIIESLNSETAQKIDAIVMEYHDTANRTHKVLEEKLRSLGFGVEVHPSQFERTMGFIFAKRKSSRTRS